MRVSESSTAATGPRAAMRQWLMVVRRKSLFGFLGTANVVALALGGCTQHTAIQRDARSKEFFPSSIYGKASPRVVAPGEPVPRGGGYYMIGKPYEVAGRTFYPTAKPRMAVGLASWYGDAFHGRRTANGEIYDCDAITAAHPTMPLPSYARITNIENKHSLIVRVNDRGPFHENRVLDVSRKTAEILEFHDTGTTRVKVEYLGPAGLDGSDDSTLLATLRTDGPAVFDGRDRASPVAVASAAAVPSPPDRPTSVRETASNEMSSHGRESVSVRPSEGKKEKGAVIAMNAPRPPVRPNDRGGVQAQIDAPTRIARAASR